MKTPPSRSFTRPRFAIPPRVALAAFAFCSASLLGQPPSRAADLSVQAEVGSNDNYRLFYDKLGNDGDWYQTDQYGYVFRPRAAQERGWRPYTDGYWAQTNAGWTWVSNESFGWACYHYGRWANIVDTGWIWVPGADWSPGYVSWRVSRDHKHVGWAPLPPEARIDREQGVESWSDTAYDVGPEAYVFIDTNRFGETSYRSHTLPVEENVNIITETENVTRVSYREVGGRSIIYNGGPEVTVIREVTGRPVREFELETRPERVDYFQRENYRNYNTVNGNRLVVATAAPDVIQSTSIRVSQPATISSRLTGVSVDRGYRGVGDEQAIERVRTSLRSQGPPPPAQVERAASASIRRDGAAALLPADRRSNAQPVPVAPNQAALVATPATTNAGRATPGNVRNGEMPPVAASPAPPINRRPRVTPVTVEPTATPHSDATPRTMPSPVEWPNTAETPLPTPHNYLERARPEGTLPKAIPAPAAFTPEVKPEHTVTRERANPSPAARTQREAASVKSTPATPEVEREPSRSETGVTAPKQEEPAAPTRPVTEEPARREPSVSETRRSEPAATRTEPEPKSPPTAAPEARGEERRSGRATSPAGGEKLEPSPKP